MHKHTPGPWKIGDQYGPVMDEIQTSEGQTIAAVWTHRGRSPMRSPTHRREADPVEECVANAHLISAAPDLLEALAPFAHFAEAVVRFADGSGNFPKSGELYCPHGHGLEERAITVEHFRDVLLAIAKATGNPVP